MEQNQQKKRDWEVICVKIETKKKLDKLKCYTESYDAAIKRLIYRRNFDVVNSSIVDLEPVTPEIPENTTTVVRELVKTIGR